MTDGFFARCFRIDRFQRKGNFNQLLDINYLQFLVKSFQADPRLREVRFGLAWTTKLKTFIYNMKG